MNPKERLARYLDDAIAMEAGLLPAFKDMADEATTEEDKQMFLQHREMTQLQHDRLVERLAQLGKKPTAIKGVVNKLAITGSELVNIMRDKEEKAVRNLITAYGTEHVEIASYLALETAANTIGDMQTAMLAREIRTQVEDAAKMIHARLLTVPARTMQPAAS